MTKWILGFALALACLDSPGSAQAATLNISINTTSLSGTSGRFEFDLFDGDSVVNNTATISNINTDGILGTVDCTIGCTGTSPYTLDDSLGFANLLQDLTLGTVFSFTLNYTNNFTSGTPDQLVLFLLDPLTNFTLLNTNLDLPYSDALVLVTLDGTPNNIALSDNAVPEPTTALLFTLCLPLLLLRKRLLPTNS